MINSHYRDYYYQAGMLIPRMGTLLAQVRQEQFVGRGALSMTILAKNSPKGPGGHFLESGHELVADALYQHVNQLGIA